MTPPSIVLDTHALLWWLAEDGRLSKRARRTIDESPLVGVSAISMWEVAMLVAKRRVELDRPVAVWANDLSATPGVAVLPIDGSTAVAAGELAEFHGDPADRLIVASTLTARARLVSKDDRIRSWAKSTGALTAVW